MLEPLATQRTLLTPEEWARTVGIGRTKAYDLLKKGAVPHLMVGASMRIDPDEALAALKAARSAGAPEQR